MQPPHGEEGHLCPLEDLIEVKLTGHDVAVLIHTLETDIQVANSDALEAILGGDRRRAVQASHAGMVWGTLHNQLLDQLFTHFPDLAQQASEEEAEEAVTQAIAILRFPRKETKE
jgi:DNA polymerase III delta subunit